MEPDSLGLRTPASANAGESHNRVSLCPVVANGAGLGAFLFAAIAGTDWLVVHKGVPEPIMLVADVIVAATGAVLFMKVIVAERSRVIEERARRRLVLQRLRMIADLNHHVRNALEAIQWSAHSSHNQALIHTVQESAERIGWALRELVPPPGDGLPMFTHFRTEDKRGAQVIVSVCDVCQTVVAFGDDDKEFRADEAAHEQACPALEQTPARQDSAV